MIIDIVIVVVVVNNAGIKRVGFLFFLPNSLRQQKVIQ